MTDSPGRQPSTTHEAFSTVAGRDVRSKRRRNWHRRRLRGGPLERHHLLEHASTR